jgi:hypothetical protein
VREEKRGGVGLGGLAATLCGGRRERSRGGEGRGGEARAFLPAARTTRCLDEDHRIFERRSVPFATELTDEIINSFCRRHPRPLHGRRREERGPFCEKEGLSWLD